MNADRQAFSRSIVRFVVNILAITSFALALALLVVWVRSYWYQTWLGHVTMVPEANFGRWNEYESMTRDGCFLCNNKTQWFTDPEYATVYDVKPGEWKFVDGPSENFGPGIPFPQNIWFDGVWKHPVPGPPNSMVGKRSFSGFRVPLWLPFLLSMIMPTLMFRRRRRERRALRGNLCQKCGYDLRASPQRCPECGTPVLLTTAVADE